MLYFLFPKKESSKWLDLSILLSFFQNIQYWFLVRRIQILSAIVQNYCLQQNAFKNFRRETLFFNFKHFYHLLLNFIFICCARSASLQKFLERLIIVIIYQSQSYFMESINYFFNWQLWSTQTIGQSLSWDLKNALTSTLFLGGSKYLIIHVKTISSLFALKYKLEIILSNFYCLSMTVLNNSKLLVSQILSSPMSTHIC